MISQEERLRATLNRREKSLIQELHASICDIIWSRFNADYTHIKTCLDLITYYHNLQDWLPILDHYQNYSRACDVAARIQFLDVCGWNINASFNRNRWVYSSPEDITIIATGAQYLATRSAYSDKQVILSHIKDAYQAMASRLPAVLISPTDFKTLVLSLIAEHKHVQLNSHLLSEFCSDKNFEFQMSYLKTHLQLMVTSPKKQSTSNVHRVSYPRLFTATVQFYKDAFEVNKPLGRTSYWLSFLGNTIIILLLTLLSSTMEVLKLNMLAGLISSAFSIYLIFVFIIGIIAQIRRLHDIGISGFLCLLNLLPVVGSIGLLIVLILPTNFRYKYHDYR